jgi:hypothetical protein
VEGLGAGLEEPAKLPEETHLEVHGKKPKPTECRVRMEEG